MHNPSALVPFTLREVVVLLGLLTVSQSFDTVAQAQHDDHVSLLQTKALLYAPKSVGPFTHRAGLVQTFSMSKGATHEEFAHSTSGVLSQPAQHDDLPVPAGWIKSGADNVQGASSLPTSAQATNAASEPFSYAVTGYLNQPQLQSDLQVPQSWINSDVRSAGLVQTFPKPEDGMDERVVRAAPGQVREPETPNNLPVPAGWSNLAAGVEQPEPRQLLQSTLPQQPQPQAPPVSVELPGWLQNMANQKATADRGSDATTRDAPGNSSPQLAEPESLPDQPTAAPVSESLPDWLRDMAGARARPGAADDERSPSAHWQQDAQHRPEPQSDVDRPSPGGSNGNIAESPVPSGANPFPGVLAPTDTSKAGLPPIGFIKTHKTGGSTIANILHRVGDARNSTFFLPAEPQKNTLGWPGAFPGEGADAGPPGHQFDIICNHAVFQETNMRAYLKPDPFFFTVLRDPIEQSKSAFDYFYPPCGKSWNERIAWIENIETGKETLSKYKRKDALRAQFQNPQAHDLGWYEYAGSNAYDHDDAKIDAWLETVDRSLGLVMLTEYFDEGLVLLRRELGLKLEDLKYVHMKSSGKTHVELTAEERTKLQDLLHVDMRLYDHFSRKFWGRWTTAGGSAKLDTEVKDLRTQSEKLAEACSRNNESLCPWFYRMDSDEYTKLLRRKQPTMFDVAHIP